MKVDHTSPLTHGFGDRVNVLFSHSPTFSLTAGAEAQAFAESAGTTRRVRSRAAGRGVSSIWRTGSARSRADYGQGKMFIFGPKITFRAQPHGTFGFLFNGIYYGAAKDKINL